MNAATIRQKFSLPADCPTSSPWGTVQHGEKITDGIFSVSTASHGGYRVYAKHNRQIPEPFRSNEGWYEEDLMWAAVVFFLPQHFEAKDVEAARTTLRSWMWEEWERHFGEEIPLSESPHKAADLFKREHANSLLTVSAWGDWHAKVPKGMVGVCAARGGSYDVGREEAYFLVPAEEYASRTNNPSGQIVIDPARHQAWDGPN